MRGLYKVCPGCGGEFTSKTQFCADCGLPLHDHAEPEPWARAIFPERLERLEPSPDLWLLRAAELDWIELLAARLAENGVPSLVHTLPTPDATAHEESLESPELAYRQHYLFVRPGDGETASRVDRQVLEERVPESDGLRPASELDLDTCPSCGASWPRDLAECPSCGLAFSLGDSEGS